MPHFCKLGWTTGLNPLEFGMISKKPKKVVVYKRKISVYQNSYSCPSCHTVYVGGIDSNIIRFRCSCGQELIVDKYIEIKDNEYGEK